MKNSWRNSITSTGLTEPVSHSKFRKSKFRDSGTSPFPEGDITLVSRHEVNVRRIYGDPLKTDGTRVLVDRPWPRGLAKAKACIDLWCNAVAPSPALGKWYAHNPRLFEEFSRRHGTETRPRLASLTSIRKPPMVGNTNI